MTLRVLSVFGTRPEAIKMAPLVLALQKSTDFDSQVCVTGQHREMLDQVLTLFKIIPDYDLALMKPGQDLFDVTAAAIVGMRDVLVSAKPDIVLVHGDTTTCLAAALAAFYHAIPVAHIEAGLRTGDLSAPFPEELNRSLVAKIASHHFAPTESARQNLLNEGIDDAAISVTGNTVIDALLMTRDSINKTFSGVYWRKQLGDGVYGCLDDTTRRTILITAHRRENFGQGFDNICRAISQLAEQHSDWDFVYPVHLNPNVRNPVNILLGQYTNVHLIEPLDYKTFVWLMDKSELVITDSGGIQEEAPSLGKPVLVMRDVTERPEAVAAGTVRLVGTEIESIVNEVELVMENADIYRRMATAINPYGDGHSVERILNQLKQGASLALQVCA
ncbi:MAG: UDP-N-acetylglucosamine 2-epimerase (non-hydrolyzing) [Gammaproteobacteria bacterium]|nr:UDP-N-acetylglucosamine 2-epimerase (non-hydrolyzing) [Gammaproteobacteria bacterium]MBQ0840684.1 UDP-N-acetylglucosamine 2-epimerase (non-hydrolyzing) [Gammaproteobacteria bacterium]